MHEFSLANQVVDKIIETALNSGAKKIREVEVLMGELTLLGEEQLMFWMEQILSSKGEIASDVKIEFKLVQTIIKCNKCRYEGRLRLKDEDHFHPVFYCPSCNQRDIEIKEGMGFAINRIEIET